MPGMKKGNMDLRISLVQPKLFWEDHLKNRDHLTNLVKGIKKNESDVIILPEMFATGFTMQALDVAEEMKGESLSWMSDMAKSKNSAVTGSLVIKEGKNFYNRLIWMQPGGEIFTYDKRHLFRMANEHEIYTPGKKRIIIEWKGWRICPLVCYDLRFPVWSRNANEYDLLLYVANWPSRRKFAWQQLLVARAIENQCYVAGVNRVGKDGNGIAYPGLSVVLDPAGETLKKFGSSENVTTVKLDKPALENYRKSFPVMMDADKFVIK